MTHLAPATLPIPMPGRRSLLPRALPVGLAPRAWLPRRFTSARPALCDEHGVPGSVPRLFSVTGAMCDFLSQLGSGLWQLFDKPSRVW
jgi:hypothetical protein